MWPAIAARDCQHAIDQGLVGFVETVALAGQQIECVAAALDQPLGPAAMSAGWIGSGREALRYRAGSPARFATRRCGGRSAAAAADRRQAPGFLRERRRRQHALVVDEAAEIGAGDGPGVALVLDEAVRDGERAALFALDQFDRAQQIGHVPVAGLLDQKAPDLDLGVNAFVDLAEDLHHAIRIHDDGGVGLLAVGTRDLVHCRRRHLREGRGRAAFQPLVALGDRGACMHGSQQQRDEILIVAGVDQRAFARAAADRGDGVGRCDGSARSRRVHLHRSAEADSATRSAARP